MRLGLVLAGLLGGCGNGVELSACHGQPGYDGALTASTAQSLSHHAGQDCLECHRDGGLARVAFATAGTLYGDGSTHALAAAGSTVDGVGQTRLTVDACGNFYALAAFLNGAIGASQPSTGPGALTMSLTMNQPTRRMGSCNATQCHDFVAAWGVHR